MSKKNIILAILITLISILLLNSCEEDSLVSLVTNNYNFVTIENISPTASALEIPKNAAIVIQFSQPIRNETFTQAFSLYSKTDSIDISNYTLSWSADNTQVTLSNPSTHLDSDNLYNIRVNSSIRSLDGNPMRDEYYSTFGTGNFADTLTPARELIQVTDSAANPNTEAAISGATIWPIISVKFRFNDTMIRSSVQYAFSLTAGGVVIQPSSTTWSQTSLKDDTVEFFFNSIPQNSGCVINLSANALDKGGNRISNPVSNLSFFSGSFSGADSYESNDDAATARTISVDQLVYANIYPNGNEDWFKIDLPLGQYHFYLKNQPADYNMEIYFPAGSAVANSTNGSTTDEVIGNFSAATPGTYYIRVWPENPSAGATSPYNLQVSVSPGNIDYQISSLLIASPTPYHTGAVAGDTISGTFNVKNIGSDAETLTRNATVYLSTNIAGTDNLGQISVTSIMGLAANTTNSFPFSGSLPDLTTAPTASGNLFLIAKVDNAGSDPTANDLISQPITINVLSAPPTAATVSEDNAFSLTVTWSPVSNADSYNIIRGTRQWNSDIELATVSSSPYNDYSSNLWTDYSYKIQAVKSSGAKSGLSISAGHGIRLGTIDFQEGFEPFEGHTAPFTLVNGWIFNNGSNYSGELSSLVPDNCCKGSYDTGSTQSIKLSGYGYDLNTLTGVSRTFDSDIKPACITFYISSAVGKTANVVLMNGNTPIIKIKYDRTAPGYHYIIISTDTDATATSTSVAYGGYNMLVLTFDWLNNKVTYSSDSLSSSSITKNFSGTAINKVYFYGHETDINNEAYLDDFYISN